VVVVVGSSVEVGEAVAVGGSGDDVLVAGTAVTVAVGSAVAVLIAVGWVTAVILVVGVSVAMETAVWLQPISKKVKRVKIGKRYLLIGIG
jgi:fatty acid desaturase